MFFFPITQKTWFCLFDRFSPVVVISNFGLTLDFTATPATPTAAESVARPVTAAATRSAASQTTSIEGTASKIKIAFFVL